LERGAKIRAYDPEAMPNMKQIFNSGVKFVEDEYEALENADALLIATEWPVFRTPEFDKMGTLLNNKVIFDGRNLYDPEAMKGRGFSYFSIGRQQVNG
jgi:UDPglucose 6-dehydrogenase